ncbi:pre-B-cell leukemia homeobox interacting protein 1b [Acipenser oxyrinchus oxyrinchus]|uniref:Pre-B-cell leukemia homeobox interacting protein 1b n=1 Tax=Acipenser oxyrinchus oxyrinchus TaxID=40147 RepID=A0AAD8FUV3_ACIOX|nr:pre-B-cell leukemia homeobox interacting protein 1b [Acipenser oxyrinchus oxyrinchus]
MMSGDNSNSNGSPSSWTILGPEGCAVESVGPGDDGIARPPAAEALTEPLSAPEPDPSSTDHLKRKEGQILQGSEQAGADSPGGPSSPPIEEFNIIPIPPPSEDLQQEGEELREEGEGPGLARKMSDAVKQAGMQLVDGIRSWGRRLIGRAGGTEDVSDSDSSNGEEDGGSVLRRRRRSGAQRFDDALERGQEIHPGRDGQEGGGLSVNKCIVGALIVLVLGLVLLSGEPLFLGRARVRGRPLSVPLQDQLNQSDPQDLQTLTTLLDTLAKENQGIRLMQEQLQTQKEELERALSEMNQQARGGDEASRLQELEQENERLRRELESVPGLQGELERLRGGEGGANDTALQERHAALEWDLREEREQTAGLLSQREELEAEVLRLRQELDKQRLLLGGVRVELQGLIGNASHGEGEGLGEGLAELEKRLGAELQDWEKGEEEGGRGERLTKREGEEKSQEEPRGGFGVPRKEGDQGRAPTKRKKESGRPWREKERENKAGGGDEKWGTSRKEGEWRKGGRGESWKEKREQRRGGERKEEGEMRQERERRYSVQRERGHKHRGEREEGEREEGERVHKHRGERVHEYRGEREREREREREGEKAKKHWQSPSIQDAKPSHRHHDHNRFWKNDPESRRHYRPPQGCSGLQDCAAQEGLKPVRQRDFEQLLGAHLEGLGTGRQELERFAQSFFEDGAFVHTRMLFRDFLEDLEQLLEREGAGGIYTRFFGKQEEEGEERGTQDRHSKKPAPRPHHGQPEPHQHSKRPHHGQPEPHQHSKRPHHGQPEPHQHSKRPHHGQPEPHQHSKRPHHGPPEPHQHSKRPHHGPPEPHQHSKQPHHGQPEPHQHSKRPHHGQPEPHQHSKRPHHGQPEPHQHSKRPHHGQPEPHKHRKRPHHGQPEPHKHSKRPHHGQPEPRKQKHKNWQQRDRPQRLPEEED